MLLDEVVALANKLSLGPVRDNANHVDSDRAWPRESIRALQASGLGGLVVPLDAGGLGHGLLGVARVCEVLGRDCPSTAISFGMHLVGSAVIAAKVTDTQRSKYLEPIARGEHLTTLALSEPGTGATFYFPETKLLRTSEGFMVEGTKSFVSNGGFADSYVLSAAPTRADASPGEFSCVVVREGAPGLSWIGEWRGRGMRGNASRSLRLEHVPVPHDDLLGDEGDEIWFVFNVITPFFLVAMAGTYLGAASAVLELARAHLIERRHSHTGAALSENNIVQHRFGSLWAQVQRTRSLIYDAARMGDAGAAQALPALYSAKAEVADAAEHVAAEAMSLIGGQGYIEGHPIQRFYRDIRAAHVMAPTTDMLRIWTGRMLFGLPLLGE